MLWYGKSERASADRSLLAGKGKIQSAAHLDSRLVVRQHLLDAVGDALRKSRLGVPRGQLARPLRRKSPGRGPTPDFRRMRRRRQASPSRRSFSAGGSGARSRRLDRAGGGGGK